MQHLVTGAVSLLSNPSDNPCVWGAEQPETQYLIQNTVFALSWLFLNASDVGEGGAADLCVWNAAFPSVLFPLASCFCSHAGVAFA